VWTCGCGTELIKAMPDFVPKETRGRVLVLWGFGRWWGLLIAKLMIGLRELKQWPQSQQQSRR